MLDRRTLLKAGVSFLAAGTLPVEGSPVEVVCRPAEPNLKQMLGRAEREGRTAMEVADVQQILIPGEDVPRYAQATFVGGSALMADNEHRIETVDGWKRFEEIKPGDRVFTDNLHYFRRLGTKT